MPPHQRGALREGIEQKLTAPVGVLAVLGFGHRDEFDRNENGALVKQLEDGVLRVRARPAPGDRSGRRIHRLPVGASRLAIRLHLELLKVGRKQPQPLVIGEDCARLAALRLDVEPVGERRDQRHVFGTLAEAEMAVHLGRSLEQLLERVPAERERG